MTNKEFADKVCALGLSPGAASELVSLPVESVARIQRLHEQYMNELSGQTLELLPECLKPFKGSALAFRQAVADLSKEERGTLVVYTAPSTGVYYDRPVPGDPPFTQVGAILRAGDAIGMIECMKVFSRLELPAYPGREAREYRLIAMMAANCKLVAQGDSIALLLPL